MCNFVQLVLLDLVHGNFIRKTTEPFVYIIFLNKREVGGT